ncbi:MAG: hypothetical protein ACK559_36420, partial [bacterium]
PRARPRLARPGVPPRARPGERGHEPRGLAGEERHRGRHAPVGPSLIPFERQLGPRHAGPGERGCPYRHDGLDRPVVVHVAEVLEAEACVEVRGVHPERLDLARARHREQQPAAAPGLAPHHEEVVATVAVEVLPGARIERQRAPHRRHRVGPRRLGSSLERDGHSAGRDDPDGVQSIGRAHHQKRDHAPDLGPRSLFEAGSREVGRDPLGLLARLDPGEQELRVVGQAARGAAAGGERQGEGQAVHVRSNHRGGAGSSGGPWYSTPSLWPRTRRSRSTRRRRSPSAATRARARATRSTSASRRGSC